MKKHQNKNQSGFSLLEMMIAVGILTIVALGLSGYMSNLAKQQQAAQENIEIMQLKTFIHSVAIDPESIYTSGDVNTVAKATTPSGFTTTTTAVPFVNKRNSFNQLLYLGYLRFDFLSNKVND
jgi:prepilin-type N-terminal cleavage/methylation domain-containing protein